MSERLDGWLSSTSRRSEIVGFTDECDEASGKPVVVQSINIATLDDLDSRYQVLQMVSVLLQLPGN